MYERVNMISFISALNINQSAFTCSELAIETLEQGVNFEHI